MIWALGDVTRLAYESFDETGEPVNAVTAQLTIVTPTGVTDIVPLTNAGVGVYTADYVGATAGRYRATFTTTGPYAGVAVDLFDVIGSTLSNISVEELRTYLGDTTADNVTLIGCLTAEQSAQADRCYIDPYTPALREALMRRVARNLAARSIPVAIFNSFEGGSSSMRVPKIDAEIARFEGPYRRMMIG
jgi:hypothetical protein